MTNKSSPTLTSPGPEAQEHFDRARELALNNSTGDQRITLDIAGELALAIKTSKSVYPRAHSMLAWNLHELGIDQVAEWHANRALAGDPTEWRAQVLKIELALSGVKVVNLQPGHFVHIGKGGRGDMADQAFGAVVGSVLGTATKTVGSLFVAGSASISQGKFRSEMDKLFAIFPKFCDSTTDVDEYVAFAEVFIDYGDALFKETALKNTRNSCYSIVASTSVQTFASSDRFKEIREAVRRAEGRVTLTS